MGCHHCRGDGNLKQASVFIVYALGHVRGNVILVDMVLGTKNRSSLFCPLKILGIGYETQQGGRRQTARTWGPPRCQGILSICPLQQLWGARPALGVRWDRVGSLYFYLDITVARGTFSAFDNHFYTSPLGSISLRLCFPEKQTSFDVFRWLFFFFFFKSHGEKLWAPLCHHFPREQR